MEKWRDETEQRKRNDMTMFVYNSSIISTPLAPDYAVSDSHVQSHKLEESHDTKKHKPNSFVPSSFIPSQSSSTFNDTMLVDVGTCTLNSQLTQQQPYSTHVYTVPQPNLSPSSTISPRTSSFMVVDQSMQDTARPSVSEIDAQFFNGFF